MTFCGCAASLQIEPRMDSMSATVVSSLLVFRTMSSAPPPACRMPKKRHSSDWLDDRDSAKTSSRGLIGVLGGGAPQP